MFLYKPANLKAPRQVPYSTLTISIVITGTAHMSSISAGGDFSLPFLLSVTHDKELKSSYLKSRNSEVRLHRREWLIYWTSDKGMSSTASRLTSPIMGVSSPSRTPSVVRFRNEHLALLTKIALNIAGRIQQYLNLSCSWKTMFPFDFESTNA